MHVVNCMVAIGGDVRMVVPKLNITIAELVVLQKLHGRDAISEIKLVGEVRNYNPVNERERLRALYNSPFEEGFQVDSLFPGVKPDLPQTLDEVVLVDPEEDQETGTIAPLEVVRFDEKNKPVSSRAAPQPPAAVEDEAVDSDEPAGVEPPELELPEDDAEPEEGSIAAAVVGDGVHLLD